MDADYERHQKRMLRNLKTARLFYLIGPAITALGMTVNLNYWIAIIAGGIVLGAGMYLFTLKAELESVRWEAEFLRSQVEHWHQVATTLIREFPRNDVHASELPKTGYVM